MHFDYVHFFTFHIIGWLANIISISSLLPQLWKTWKTKSARDISHGWTVLNAIAQLLWIIYGIDIQSYELWIGSVISFIIIVILIGMKIAFDRKQKQRNSWNNNWLNV